MEEAFKYNTTVSLHINLTDSYTTVRLGKSMWKKGLIGRTEDGALFEIGTWAGKKSYQIDYKAEWESGYMGGFADLVLKRKRILPMNYAKMK